MNDNIRKQVRDRIRDARRRINNLSEREVEIARQAGLVTQNDDADQMSVDEDIVKRLRGHFYVYADVVAVTDEAAVEIEKLRIELNDTFRTLAAVLLTTGQVRVAESTIVKLNKPTIHRIDQSPYVIYGATE
jgi:hypothetical protein